MQPYIDLMQKILQHGRTRADRTGVGTYSLFGESLRFDLSEGFPLLTTKRVHFKSVKAELLWFLKGTDDPAFLHENGCTIWDEWIIKEGPNKGKLPNNYGVMWRKWPSTCPTCKGKLGYEKPSPFDGGRPSFVLCETCNGGGQIFTDQIAKVIDGIKKDPTGRRHIVTAWNPALVDETALPWCHAFFQFYVTRAKKDRLSCHMYQRSADYFLGVPFNIASYALLTHMIAAQCDMVPDELILTFGDVHLYRNHTEQVIEQLRRKPRVLPELLLEPAPSIDDYKMESINVAGYDPLPAIAAPVAV